MMGLSLDMPADSRRQGTRWGTLGLAVCCLLATLLLSPLAPPLTRGGRRLTPSQAATLQASRDRCSTLHVPAGPPPGFAHRSRSERAIEGVYPLVIRNVTLWTARPEPGDEFGEVLEGVDVFVAEGIIQAVERSGKRAVPRGATVVDGHLAWMTPGLIDVHVHAGLSAIGLRGIADTNSFKGPVQPALRSIDALNNHDWSFVSIASGGITTGLALPGSAGNVGGQAFPVKMGRLGKRAASEGGWWRVVDPPRSLVLPGEATTGREDMYSEETGMKRPDGSSSFRYMKMACGENPSRTYEMTRMDSSLQWRTLLTSATKLREEQDAFCEKAKANTLAHDQIAFPDDLALEAVVDVLRGKVKVNTHCYTMEDLTSFVAHTNEFKFPLAAFHHAHEAYLVPELLNNVYGGTPAVALFSLNANYKTESYFGSPFANAILARHNITTHTKSDHPVTDSKRLLAQVAQTHHFGLSAGRALRGVTSAAAKTLGLDHRLGQARPGYDADLVLWDRNPLRVGAGPREVIIDGVRQHFDVVEEVTAKYGAAKSREERPVPDATPRQANYSAEIRRVMDSGPEIAAWESSSFPIPQRRVDAVHLYNVSLVYSLEGPRGAATVTSRRVHPHDGVLVTAGRVACIGNDRSCPGLLDAAEQVDLQGGTIIPGLVAFGTELGMADIGAEPAARDGLSSGLLTSHTARAVDGLRLGGNSLRFAHVSGIRSIVSFPTAETGLKQGIATHFDAGAAQLVDAIRAEEVALHLTVDHWQGNDAKGPSLGQQIASIRAALRKASAPRQQTSSGSDTDDEDDVWRRVSNGSLPLIVNAKQAETIGQLIKIKQAFPATRLILSGADEAGYADTPAQLRQAGIPVLVVPVEWPHVYDARRAVREGVVKKTGLLSTLVKAGVQTGLLVDAEGWRSFSLLWDTAAAGDKAGLSKAQALGLATASLANILDIDLAHDVVAYDASPFEYGAKPVAIAAPWGVDLMDG